MKFSLSKKTIIVIASVVLAVALIVTGLLVFLGGGSEDGGSENEVFMTRAEWIAELGANFGMAEYVQQEPYFADVPQDHSSYAFVQSTKEWNVLRDENKFNPDEIATRAFVAETAMIAALRDYDSSCIEKSAEELIQLAHQNGIMESTLADELMTKHECSLIVKAAKKYYLNYRPEEFTDIQIKEGVVDFRAENEIQVNGDVVTMPESLGADLKVGTVFIAPDGVSGVAKKVVSVEKKDGQVIVTTQMPEASEVLEKINFYFVGGPSSIEDIVPLQDGVTISPLSEEEEVFAKVDNDKPLAVNLAQATSEEDPKRTEFPGFEVNVNLTKGTITPKADFTDYFSLKNNLYFEQLFGKKIPEDAGTIQKKTGTIFFPDKDGKLKVAKSYQYKEGYEITGKLKVKDIWIEAAIDTDGLKLETANVKVHFNADFSIGIKGSIKASLDLFKTTVPGPFGLSFDVVFYLYVDYNGEFRVGVKVDETAAVAYENKNLKCTQETNCEPYLEVGGNVSYGAAAKVVVNWFMIPIIDATAKVGAGLDVEADLHISGQETMLCMDATVYYPLVNISVGNLDHSLAKKLKITGDVSLVGKESKSLIKADTLKWFHYEISGDGVNSVENCTWGTKTNTETNNTNSEQNQTTSGDVSTNTGTVATTDNPSTDTPPTGTTTDNSSTGTPTTGTTSTDMPSTNTGSSGGTINGSVVASGKCGPTATWTVDSNGRLTISGSGYLYTNDYWADYRNAITEVIVEEGITQLAQKLRNMPKATKIVLPQSLTMFEITKSANLDSLKDVYYMGTSTQWDEEFSGSYENFDDVVIHFISSGLEVGTRIAGVSQYGGGSWTFDSDGTLTVYGSGIWGSTVPWYDIKKNIKKVIVAQGVERINANFFSGCENLVAVEIADSVREIGSHAFSYCTSLVSIQIPNSVKTIDSYAFSNCTSLTNVTFPKGIETIGKGWFSDCTSLTTITIPESVSIIEEWAFADCTSLSSITLPSNLHQLKDYCFYNCTSLTHITLPKGFNRIYEDVFSGCENLASITIPKSIRAIGDGSFQYLDSLKDVYYEGTKSDWSYYVKVVSGQNKSLYYATFHYQSYNH